MGQHLEGHVCPALNPVIQEGPFPSLGCQFPHLWCDTQPLPEPLVVRSHDGCEWAWSRLIQDRLKSLVSVPGPKRETVPGTDLRLQRGQTEELAPCHPPSQLYPQRRQGRVTRLSIWASIVVARKQRLVAGTGGAAGALQHGVVPLLGRGGAFGEDWKEEGTQR